MTLSRVRAFTTLLLLVAPLALHTANAQDGAIGRVIAVGKTTGTTVEVELEVVSGSLFNNSDVEVFTPRGKVVGKLLTGPTIDMLMRGDKVKVSLALSAAGSPAGGLVAERGKFASFAAITRAAGSAAAPAAASSSAPPPTTKSFAASRVCPFSAAELRAALGLTLKDGAPRDPVPFAGGASLGCVYEGERLTAPALTVNQIVMDDPTKTNGYLDRLAGGVRKIPGDPDGAMFQEKQGDLTNATLHYIRKGTIVELRLSVRPTDARFAQYQQKLAALRRIP